MSNVKGLPYVDQFLNKDFLVSLYGTFINNHLFIIKLIICSNEFTCMHAKIAKPLQFYENALCRILIDYCLLKVL